MIKFTLSLFLISTILGFNGNTVQKEDIPVMIYVNDPLCSWCYGFSPEVEKIKVKYQNVADFKVLEGGLRPYAKDPMSDELRISLKQHWEEIHEETGQAFNYGIINDKTFIYDTEVPCRAVVTMRKIKPSAAFDFLKAIQSAFYVNNRNTNNIETYLELLPQWGIDPKEFSDAFQSEEIKTQTKRDFELTEAAGIFGFPAIIIKRGDKIKVITSGYDKFSRLEKKLDKELLQ